MDDFVQCRSIPRIKYFEIRHRNTTSRWRRSQFIHWINQLHFFDPLHRLRRKLWTSTYLGFELYLPANKGCWCEELVKMEIRNLLSLLVCTIILWRVSSTEDDWIFGWRSRLASQILILFWSFTLFRCRHIKRLFNDFSPWIQFLRIRSCGGSLWICKKKFPDIPGVSQMSGSPFLQRGDTNEGLNNFSKNKMFREYSWLIGNVWISTAYRFSVLEVLKIVQTIYFIL